MIISQVYIQQHQTEGQNSIRSYTVSMYQVVQKYDLIIPIIPHEENQEIEHCLHGIPSISPDSSHGLCRVTKSFMAAEEGQTVRHFVFHASEHMLNPRTLSMDGLELEATI